MGDIVSGIFGGGGGGGSSQPAPQQQTVVNKPQSMLGNSLFQMAGQMGQQQAGFTDYVQPQPFSSFGQQLLQSAIPQVGTPSATQLATNVAGQTIGRWAQQSRMGLPQ